MCVCFLSVMSEFEQLPAHLMEQPHLFAMDDLLKAKKGQLVVQARAVLHAAIDHVEHCEVSLRLYRTLSRDTNDVVFIF